MKEEELRERAGENLDIYVVCVSLDRFRNYLHLDVDLDRGFNLITGINGQGKTNFLESLYLLSTTRLLRGQRDAEAVLEGETMAYVSCELSSHTELGMTIEPGARKRASLNGVKLPKAADVIGRLPCVSISSFDLDIVKGEPSDRRLFLDLELSALSPAYLKHLAVYKRAVEQRNALLRDSREVRRPPELFETWEEQIASAGAAIRQARRAYVEELRPIARQRHATMADGEQFDLEYVQKGEEMTADRMIEELAQSRHVDIVRGGTSVGPHRDDLLLLVGGRDARLFGSQGQQRTSVVALKLATLAHQSRMLRQPPLLLLDDILSDLDERRRSLLVQIVLDEAGQTILTCTEESAAGPEVLRRAKIFHTRKDELGHAFLT